MTQNSMSFLEVFGYENDDVKVLKDDGQDVDPTRENIVSGSGISLSCRAYYMSHQINAMTDLVSDAQPGDHFVFHCESQNTSHSVRTAIHDKP